MKRWGLILLIMASCQHGKEPLIVRNTYLSADRYASLYVESPDPHQDCPSVGQRTDIFCHVPREIFNEGDCEVIARFRYGDTSHEEMALPVTKERELWTFFLMDDLYFEKMGMISYHVALYCHDELIAVAQHQLWAEIIELDDIDSK